MNWLDIVFAVLIVCSVIAGFRVGLARSVIGFVAAITGMLCGFWFYGLAGGYLHKIFSSKAVSNVLGFCLVFVTVVIAGAILGRFVAMLFRMVGFSWLDRLMGGAFGLVRGLVVVAALVAVVLAFAPAKPPDAFVDSRIMPYAIEVSGVVARAAPHELKESFRQTVKKLEAIWAEGVDLLPRKPPKEE